MTEPSTGAAPTVTAPETLFDEGFEAGKGIAADEYREQLEDQLLDAGFDPEDVEEALYDPDPRRRRRGGRHKRHTRHVRKASKTYDPAPGRRRRRGRRARTYDPGVRSKSRGTLSKLRKYAMPGVAVGTFLLDYNARAGVLKTQGAKLKNGTAVTDIFSAIMYDFENFDSNAAMGRLQSKAMDYGAPLVGGFAVKKLNVAGKYSGLVGDILMGFGAGKLGKAILDPPVVTNPYVPKNGCCGIGTGTTVNYVPPAGAAVRSPQVNMPAPQPENTVSRNPYLNGG